MIHDSFRLLSHFTAPKSAIQKQIRSSYWSYLESVIFEGDSQPGRNKKFYSFVKHNKTVKCEVSTLKSDGITYTDSLEKANVLNKQFKSVFSRPQPLSLKQMCKYLVHPPAFVMSPINITAEGIEKLLCGLSPNKANGPDQTSPRVLKELRSEVAPILCEIFRLSLKTGIVPQDWKEATIAPVYKKGPKSKPSNYRPISVTCIPSKLMEHITVSSMMKHSDSYEILRPLQHGFRSNRSCETQLVRFTQDAFDNLEKGQHM